MEIKSRKIVLCLIEVGLLDLRVRGQSVVTGAERRWGFVDFRVSRFLQSGEEKSQCGWCVVSSFASVSVSVSLSLSSGLRSVVCLLLIWPHSRYICFLRFSLLIEFLFFYREGYGLAEKLLLIIFIFWQIPSTICYALILCAEPPFFHFEESLNTNNIRWMLAWALIAIIILCVRYIRRDLFRSYNNSKYDPYHCAKLG